jgi:hypothetical protein
VATGGGIGRGASQGGRSQFGGGGVKGLTRHGLPMAVALSGRKLVVGAQTLVNVIVSWVGKHRGVGAKLDKVEGGWAQSELPYPR